MKTINTGAVRMKKAEKKLKQKNIFSRLVSKIMIIFACSHVTAADVSAPSLVPQRPFNPCAPTPTINQTVKNQFHSHD